MGQQGVYGHKSFKRCHTQRSLQVKLCSGFIGSSQKPMNYAKSVPIFTSTQRVMSPRSHKYELAELGFEPSHVGAGP